MQFLNKIELVGIVGAVRTQQYGERTITRMSLVTNYSSKNEDGIPVIETTWHNVIAVDSESNNDALHLQKGDAAHVLGRVRIQHCTDQQDYERNIIEIIASSVKKLDEPVSEYQKEQN